MSATKGDWDDVTATNNAPSDAVGPSWLQTTPIPAPAASPVPTPSAPASPPPAPSALPPLPARVATIGESYTAAPTMARSASPGAALPQHRLWHTPSAGATGLTTASNAAADPVVPRPLTSSDKPRRESSARPTFQLLWVDEPAVLAADLDRKTSDEESDGWIDDPPERSIAGDAKHARASAARAIGQRDPVETAALSDLLGASVSDTGEIGPTFCTLRGELQLCLDELERLRALASTLEPLGQMDKRLQDAVLHAKEVSERKLVPTDAIDAATRRLLDAHHQVVKGATDLGPALERTLVRARAFQRRTVLGDSHVRALFSDGGAALPIYLPETAAALWPLTRKLHVTLLIELLPSQDDTEEHELSGRAIALARMI